MTPDKIFLFGVIGVISLITICTTAVTLITPPELTVFKECIKGISADRTECARLYINAKDASK